MYYCGCDVHRVDSRLAVAIGLRGGADERCHIQTALSVIADVVEDTEVDMYAAIDRAIDRARRTVVRKVDRNFTLLRQREPLVLDAE